MDLTALKRVAAQASFEAQGTHSLTDYAAHMFKPLIKGLSSFTGYFRATDPVIALRSDPATFLRLMKHAPYADMRDYQVYVPEGLDVTYLDYLDALMPAVEHAAKVPKALDDFTTYLSLLIHRPDATQETKSFLNTYAEMDKEREAALAKIAACFSKGLTHTQRPLGQVMKNNASWSGVTDTLNTLNTTMSKVSHKHLNQKIEETLTLLQTTRHQIETQQKAVSGETLTNLSSGTYHLAQELEFYSVIWYRLESFTYAVDDTMRRITDLESKQYV